MADAIGGGGAGLPAPPAAGVTAFLPVDFLLMERIVDVKFSFQGCRDSLTVMRRWLDLVGYSSTRRTLGRIYWQWSRLASSSGHPGASWWFLTASLVNFLHLPALGQLAASQGYSALPPTDRAALARGGGLD